MTLNTKLFDGVVIFCQVVRHKGFSAAAEATGHSTSYISKEINKLEARLGLRLLQRTTRSISLTAEGEIYFQQCKQLVSDAENALGMMTQSHVAPKGRLRISCPVAFGTKQLQPIISQYAQLYPQVELELDLNDRHIDVIQEGYDLAIRATGQLEESSLICKKIYQCEAYTLASKEFIEKYGKPTTPLELTEYSCICYANMKRPSRWHYQSLTGDNMQVDVNQAILSNNAQMQLAMMQDGHGICRLPEFCLDNDTLATTVTLFEDYKKPIINVYVVYPSKKYLSPRVRGFIDLLSSRLNHDYIKA